MSVKRHGFRGVPPLPTFDFDALPDSTVMTEEEAAQVTRLAKSTLSDDRRRPKPMFEWFKLPNGAVRTTAGSIRRAFKGGYRLTKELAQRLCRKRGCIP